MSVEFKHRLGGVFMSDRERIIQLLDEVPAYKLGYVLAYVQGLTADEDADDAYCEQLYQHYLNDPERGQTYTRTSLQGTRHCFMSYTILYEKAVVKFLKKQPEEQQRRIMEAIHALPERGDIKQLKGHAELFRLRVGSYRIIYTVDHGKLVVCVIDIGNRGQIYNRY